MKKTELTFWALMGTFALILSTFFVPAVREILKGLPFLIMITFFPLLGAFLIFFTLKEKVKGILKKFLTLTAASALGFFVFTILHNLFYGLEVITNQPALGLLHALFFIISVFVCPLGFLIGAVGSTILFVKKH